MSKDKEENKTYSSRLREMTAVLHKHEITRGVRPEKLRMILEDLGPTYICLLYTSNPKNMEQTMAILKEDFTGFCFVNLVDFDMLYGHRNDIDGYVNALNEVDVQLGELMAGMRCV